MSEHTPDDLDRLLGSEDRRNPTLIAPPPFATAAGEMVAEERRSPTDRRAAWIREYVLELPQKAD